MEYPERVRFTLLTGYISLKHTRPMAKTPDILLVEDDQELLKVVSNRLTESGYGVRTAETGTAALDAVSEQLPDLVLLDVMLPELDGLEVCRRLRASHPLLYIMMLTARSEEMDRVVGLRWELMITSPSRSASAN